MARNDDNAALRAEVATLTGRLATQAELIATISDRLDAVQSTVAAQSGRITVAEARMDNNGLPQLHVPMDPKDSKEWVRANPSTHVIVSRPIRNPVRLTIGQKIRANDFGGPARVCELIDAGLGLTALN